MMKLFRGLCVLFFCATTSLISEDVLLEFKGAAFFPTNNDVKRIYGKAAGLYGAEVTFELCEDSQWYGFASIDFLSKSGRSIGLCDCTQMHMVPLGLGVKYLSPFKFGDLYIGLGLQPLHLTTINCSDFVFHTTSQWGVGGIFKMGSFFDLPHHFFVDLFFDYSFVKVCTALCCDGPIVPVTAVLNGAIVGAGLGYRFN